MWFTRFRAKTMMVRKIINIRETKVFMIGLYHGMTKDEKLSEFLNDFVEDADLICFEAVIHPVAYCHLLSLTSEMETVAIPMIHEYLHNHGCITMNIKCGHLFQIEFGIAVMENLGEFSRRFSKVSVYSNFTKRRHDFFSFGSTSRLWLASARLEPRLLVTGRQDTGSAKMRTIKKHGRPSYNRRSRRNRSLGPLIIAPPQSTGEQFAEISYSSTQPLDLTSSPVIDLDIQEIFGYSPPPFEERFPPPPPLEERFPLPPLLEERFSTPPPHEEGFPLPLPSSDQLSSLSFRLNPEPIDWDRMFRFFTSPSFKGDRLVPRKSHTLHCPLQAPHPDCACTVRILGRKYALTYEIQILSINF
ncbi:hypothetical protein G5I_01495 [Acromyrmex echinatior]|uniref:Uncharacterized protein n=1 Tax=Acromyrmex echinatior TaxID=103372 RepID=F4W7S2_ACREC|nr:hypothetical protein G5I_01495 [Acromyrmex echinatior]